MNGALPEPARDLALLAGRIVLGVVLFAHGWQKLVVAGISETHVQFAALGIPAAIASASFVAFVEFAGGVLLVLGALTPVVVMLHLVVMVGAAALVHISNGIFVADGGWELVGVIAVSELIIAACGPGRFSVDQLVLTRLRRNQAASSADADPAAVTDRVRPEEADPVVDPRPEPELEPATSVFPVVSGPASPAPSAPPVFPDPQPGSPARQRRIPRPITPLLGREPRRQDHWLAGRSDDSAGR